MVIHYNNVLQSHTTRIINATFKDNFSSKFCPGSDLLLLFHISSDNIQDKSHSLFPIFVSKSKFSNHNTVYSRAEGIIYMYIYNPSTFINVIIIFV